METIPFRSACYSNFITIFSKKNCVNFGFLIEFQEKTLQNYFENINNEYDESNRTDIIFTLTFTTLFCTSSPFLFFINHFITIF